VFCGKSDFFKAACNGDFLEAKTRVINLQEEEMWIIQKLINFFYYEDYTFTFGSHAINIPFVMYSTSLKYQVGTLKDLAERRILQSMDEGLFIYQRRKYFTAPLKKAYQAVMRDIEPCLRSFHRSKMFAAVLLHYPSSAIDLLRAEYGYSSVHEL